MYQNALHLGPTLVCSGSTLLAAHFLICQYLGPDKPGLVLIRIIHEEMESGVEANHAPAIEKGMMVRKPPMMATTITFFDARVESPYPWRRSLTSSIFFFRLLS